MAGKRKGGGGSKQKKLPLNYTKGSFAKPKKV